MLTRLTIAFYALVLAVAGCGGNGNPPPPNVRGCWGTGCAMVTTSHYNPDFTGVGTLNAVQMAQNKIVRDLDASLDPDTSLFIDGNNKLYVLNRTNGALRRYDLASLAVEEEIPTGTAEAPNTTSMPGDFWRAPTGYFFVSLSGNDAKHALGVLDESQPNAGVIDYIEIPAAATDPDGMPEAGTIYACKGLVYVLLGDYTIMGRNVVYNGNGRIAIVDPIKDQTLGFITLAGKNPSGIAAEGSDCSHVLVTTASSLTTQPDGTAGIERVDLGARSSSGFVVTDTTLGGRPSGITVASPTLAFVQMYADPQMGADGMIYLASAKVAAWNPSTGAALGDVTGNAGFINFAKVSPDGLLFVGVGAFGGMAEPGKLAQGLYWGKADGTALPATPIDLGDTPQAIAFQP